MYPLGDVIEDVEGYEAEEVGGEDDGKGEGYSTFECLARDIS